MKGRDGQRNKDYRWRCRSCRKFFTVRTGTIFEETRLPLRVWVYAFWKACSSKKGIAALQLAREMEITHKSALFVLRRIRHGLGEQNQEKLTGTIEVDEAYIGGRPRIKGVSKWGRGTKKAPILGVVQRGGDVRIRMLDRITSERIGEFIAENADLTCRMITDELPAGCPILAGCARVGILPLILSSPERFSWQAQPPVYSQFSRARRRTFRIPPFQQKRDADPDENEWPDPTRVDVNIAPTGEQEHDASDQKYRAGGCAMIGSIPKPVGEAADGHGEKAGSRRRRMQRMPIDSDEAQHSPG